MAKCAQCSKIVTKRKPGVQCIKCSKWYHGSCTSLSTEQLNALSLIESVEWKCPACILATGGKARRISVIIPDPDEDDTDAEETVSSKRGKTLHEIHDEVRKLRETVREIIRDELQNTLKFYSNKIDEYEEKVKNHEMRVKMMENQCKEIADTCRNLSLRNDVLEQKLNKLEQAQTSNDVELCGIAEQENENINNIASSVCQILKQSQSDIIRVVRKRKPFRPASAQAERYAADSPIIISLREGKRDRWYEAARSLKITSKDMGIEGDSRIYIRESLTSTTAYLLWKAKTSLKNKELCKYVWCKNGQIMVRKNEGDKKIYYVRSEKDIDQIGKELKKNRTNAGT